MRKVLHGGLLLAGLALAACGGASEEWVSLVPVVEGEGATIRIVGTIRRIELEGGFFAILGSDGVSYDPTNLPSEFQKDGLAVEAEARRRDDVAGIHMAGPIVDLLRIRLR